MPCACAKTKQKLLNNLTMISDDHVEVARIVQLAVTALGEGT